VRQRSDVLEVVVTRAVIGGVREGGRLLTGAPAKSQSQNTRWQAAWPMVVQSGHRFDDGRSANCSLVIFATTSRRRRLILGHVPYAGRIVTAR
jgi:hypothetical protein